MKDTRYFSTLHLCNMPSFKKLLLSGCMLFFLQGICSSQSLTSVNDSYVFQVLSQANGMTLESTEDRKTILSTSSDNVKKWEKAIELIETAMPEPLEPMTEDELAKTISYMREVVENMNTKK